MTPSQTSKRSALIFILSFAASSQAFAEYPWGNSYSEFFFHRNTQTPRISLDFDPQDIKDSSFRIASRENRLEDLERLISEGADLNSQSDTGETALMYSARNCSVKAVQTLLKHGAEVNLKNENGRTALTLAAMESCAKVVRLLISHPGTHVKERDNFGKTALDYAKDLAVSEVGGPTYEIVRMLSPSRKIAKNTAKKPSPEPNRSTYPLLSRK